MLAPNHRKRGGDVVLRVVVPDGAVALRLSDVVGEWEGWSRRSAHRVRRGVVGGGPTQLRQIITRKQRRPGVDEAAARQVHIENGGWRERVVQVQREQLAVVEFRATILTETGSQWIAGKIRQPEIRKPAKEAGIAPKVLISASDELVRVSARSGGARIIVHHAGTIRRRKNLLPYRGCRLAELRGRNTISQARWVAWIQSVSLASPGSLIHGVRVEDGARRGITNAVGEAGSAQRREISVQHSGTGNGGGVRRSRSLPVLLPADVEESLVLDHRASELEPVLVLRPRGRLVLLAVF